MHPTVSTLDANPGRPPLDRVLGNRRAFAIDEIACAAAAQIIRSIGTQRSANRNQTRALPQELLFRISVSAICHQINWDFLSLRLGKVFDEVDVGPAFLASVTSRHLEEWLSGYHRPERIRGKERAALLRNVGLVILQSYSGDITLLLERSRGKLYGESGFVSCLDDFIAFSADPLRKKSNVLAHDIIRDELVQFEDENEIKPAIDYHIIRLYLRSGRVVPIHKEAFDLLKRRVVPPARFVKRIREAVSEALLLTAHYAGMSVPVINGIEWDIGRDICERSRPRCTGPRPSTSSVLLDKRDECPYAPFCHAYADPEWRKLTEPDLNKNFY